MTATREELLAGELVVHGRVVDSSNVALLVEVCEAGEEPTVDANGTVHPRSGGAPTRWAIYKPVRGERPLWDFPDGTLAGREVATALVAEAMGYAVVPPTVLRDGPLGVGSVQAWVGDPFAAVEPDELPVRVVRRGRVPHGWLTVIDGELGDGTPVVVAHEDRADLRSVAVLDAVLNNSDRKGSHLVRDAAGELRGFDHGLTFHAEPKLRTVLWGWAGQPLGAEDLAAVAGLAERCATQGDSLVDELLGLLPAGDVDALRQRVERLARAGVHPLPGRGWPSVPWPAI